MKLVRVNLVYLELGFKSFHFSRLHILQVGYQPEQYEAIIGCLFYYSGVIFFKLDGTVPFAHTMWHIMVCLGTGYHSSAFVEMLNKNSRMLLHHEM